MNRTAFYLLGVVTAPAVYLLTLIAAVTVYDLAGAARRRTRRPTTTRSYQ